MTCWSIMFRRRLTRCKMELYRKHTKRRSLIAAMFVFIFVVVSYQRHVYWTLDGVSYRLWRSVRLDSHELLDRKTNTTSRHGPPLDLYYETSRGYIYRKYPYPLRKPSEIPECSEIIRTGQRGQYKEMTMIDIKTFLEKQESELYNALSELSCHHFKRFMGYVQKPLSDMERDFPIAYSVLVYTDFLQLELLLRAIYRPQNVYCIHVDLKADRWFHLKVEKLTRCFDNIFLASRSINVTWGDFSVLEPEVVCLEDLWNTSLLWKYWINLTGQEFPLRTNYELVKILRSLNGSNNVEGLRGSDIVFRLLKPGFPPHNLFPVKGAVHVVISRDFAHFLLHNIVPQDVLQWSRTVNHPDETFFNILNYNPSLKAPGSYKGTSKTSAIDNPFIARFKNWFDEWYCYGKQVRGICIFGVGDLPLLATREELFANKFHLTHAPEVLYCLGELIYNRTVDEYLGILDFNVSYYETRDFVKNKF